jgi:hypothetical protein
MLNYKGYNDVNKKDDLVRYNDWYAVGGGNFGMG